MTIISEISMICKSRNLSVEDIIDPKSDRAIATKDSLIRMLVMRGMQYRNIREHLNASIEYIESIAGYQFGGHRYETRGMRK